EALPRVAISGGRRGQRRGLAATAGVARAPAHDRRLSRRAERCDEWFTRPKRPRGKQTGCGIRRKRAATTPPTLSRSRLPDRPPRATRARARRATRCPRLIRTPAAVARSVRRPAAWAIAGATAPTSFAAR